MSRFRDLRVGAIVGVFWTGGGQVLRNIISLGTSVLLARLLVPEDFGVFALSVVLVEFAQMFALAGFGASIVQQQQTNARALSTLFWINLGLALLFALLLCAAAMPVAAWFRQPQLVPVLALASLSVLLAGAMVVPTAMLNMELRFRDLTMAQTLGSLLGSAGAIGIAAAGGGVWALAAQPVIGSTITLFDARRRLGWVPQLVFDWPSVRGMMRFSGQLLASTFFNFLNRNAWAAMIGRTLGAQQVGLFNLGQQIVFAPIAQFSGVVVRVLFPTLSKLNNEPEQFQRVWLRAFSTVGFLTFPILAGMMATLDDLVPVVFGNQWLGVIPVLQFLCPVAMLQSVCTLSGSVLMSRGSGMPMLVLSIVALSVMLLSLFVGQRWGLPGVTVGFAVGGVLTQLLQLSVALRLAHISLATLGREIGPALVCAVVTAVTMGTTAAVLPGLHAALRLLACSLLGAAVYLALSWKFNRRTIDFLMRSFRPSQAH